MHHGIHEQFTNAAAKKNFKPDDVAEGREYVKAYVEFIHYAERLFQAASKPAEGQFHENEQGGHSGKQALIRIRRTEKRAYKPKVGGTL